MENHRGRRITKKKLFIIVGVSIAVIAVLVTALCLAYLVDWTTDEEYFNMLKSAIKSEYIQPTVSVANTITLDQDEKTVAVFDQKYVIESNDKCILQIKEIYYLDGEKVSDIEEEYLLIDGYISMRRNENGSITTYKIIGTIDNFREIIKGELEKTDINIDNDSIFESQFIRKDDISFSAKFDDNATKSIVGDEYCDMDIYALMGKDGVLKRMELNYKTNDDRSKVSIVRTVDKQGEIIIPQWINELE